LRSHCKLKSKVGENINHKISLIVTGARQKMEDYSQAARNVK